MNDEQVFSVRLTQLLDRHLPTIGLPCQVRALPLTLQLRSAFDVGFSCCGLVGAAPQRPGDHMGWADATLGQAHRHTPDLLDRPADQEAAR